MGSYFHKFIGLGLFFFEFCKICVVHIFKCASTLKKTRQYSNFTSQCLRLFQLSQFSRVKPYQKKIVFSYNTSCRFELMAEK